MADPDATESSPPASAPSALELRSVTKAFPGVVALDDVSFDVRPGEVHALLGENGAGKSTLIKIVSGVYRPDQGEIRINGQPVSLANPGEAQHRGIATIYQEFMRLRPRRSQCAAKRNGRPPYTGITS